MRFALTQALEEEAPDPVARVGELMRREEAERPAYATEEATEQWTAKAWLLSIASEVSEVIAAALGANELASLRSLSRVDLEAQLKTAGLSGLTAVITAHAEQLSKQTAATGAELNEKFESEEGNFQLAFGSLESFYGGLEAMLGPPLMVQGRLDTSMKQEHTGCRDSKVEFTSSNRVTTTSETEWEVVEAPQPAKDYPDRATFARSDPRRRRPQAIEELLPKMEEQNQRLAAIHQSPMVKEELLAARLYSGPMCIGAAPVPRIGPDTLSSVACSLCAFRYHKYNLVLRSFSGVADIRKQFERDCKGNLYPTTIHGINSAVIKLSKLQVACPVYRGSTRAVLPPQFWKKDEFGLSGGVEFGFTSTTVERAQAEHYAQGQASLVFESQMGLIDRGADISWLSQYPHEREVLFGPLLGQQPLAMRVQGSTLVVATRMSASQRKNYPAFPDVSPFLHLPDYGRSQHDELDHGAGAEQATPDAQGHG